MAPRMGVITTAIALSLTVILGLTVTSTTTSGEINIGGWVADMTETKKFNNKAADSATCNLDNPATSITFENEAGSEIGTATGTATMDNCQTTVDAEVTANIKSVQE